MYVCVYISNDVTQRGWLNVKPCATGLLDKPAREASAAPPWPHRPCRIAMAASQ